MNLWTQDIMEKTWNWKEKKLSNTQSHLRKRLIDKGSSKFINFWIANFISQTLNESFCSPRKNTLERVAAK